MDLLKAFGEFLLPFLYYLSIWGLVGKLMAGKKFTDIFADYPVVAFNASYVLLVVSLRVQGLVALICGILIYLTTSIVMMILRPKEV